MNRRKFLLNAFKIGGLAALYKLGVGVSEAGLIQQMHKSVIARKNSSGGGGGGGGATPDFGGTVALDSEPAAGRWEETASGGTTVIGLNTTVGTGNVVHVLIHWQNGTQTLTSVADSQSNTYTIHQNINFSITMNIAIASAYITTGLGTSDTITITWGSPEFSFRAGMVGYSTNCGDGTPDTDPTEASGYSSSPSLSASTTAANTHAIGIVASVTATYSSGNWSSIGTVHTYGSRNLYYVEETFSSAGSKDPGGTLSGVDDWGVVWVAFD